MIEIAKFVRFGAGRKSIGAGFKETLIEKNEVLLPLFSGESVRIHVKESIDGGKKEVQKRQLLSSLTLLKV